MGLRNAIAGGLGAIADKLDARARRKRHNNRLIRSYAAANIDRLTQDWRYPETTADYETYKALKVLRARSRELFRNDDYLRRFVNLVKTNVVGPTGIRLQASAMDSDGTKDKGANRKIEAAWRDWGKKTNCSVCGTLSLWDIANQVIASCIIDGEILVQKVQSLVGSKYQFALRIIEADHLDLEKNEEFKDGRRIVMGVEMDSNGKRLAYWILKRHPGDQRGHYQHLSERVPADKFIHVYMRERPGQSRGVPWVVTAMHRLRQLGAYEEAELIAARVAASKMGFFIPEGSEEYLGDDVEGDGDDTVPITTAEPGTFEQLPMGMSFQAWNPDHPVAAFESFSKTVLRGIASGLNVSYVGLSNNLEGVSYSSIRSGELADRDAWRMLQNFLIESFYDFVYEAWLGMALATQALALPSGKYDKFTEIRWKPRGWKWVDPLKESNAAITDVQNGFKSLFDVAAESGYDLEEILEENARAKEMAESYGLTLPVFNGEQNGQVDESTTQTDKN
jgi:lambda family phage portal protein